MPAARTTALRPAGDRKPSAAPRIGRLGSGKAPAEPRCPLRGPKSDTLSDGCPSRRAFRGAPDNRPTVTRLREGTSWEGDRVLVRRNRFLTGAARIGSRGTDRFARLGSVRTARIGSHGSDRFARHGSVRTARIGSGRWRNPRVKWSGPGRRAPDRGLPFENSGRERDQRRRRTARPPSASRTRLVGSGAKEIAPKLWLTQSPPL